MTSAGTAPPPAVQTVTGRVSADALGVVLPHEHLFNDLSAVLDAPAYGFSGRLPEREVSAASAWALRQDPYCCPDNLAAKSVDELLPELALFQEVGGSTLVDATSSGAIGRDPLALRDAARRSGLNIVMGCGAYLEKFEGERISAATIDALAHALGAELTDGVGETGVRPGVIGEIGVSPDFTAAEAASLRAAALAQLDSAQVPLLIHLPGWQRRGHDVLDIVLDEIGVPPDRVVLGHMDPSGADHRYQDSLADRGVWLEFDMVGMEVAFPNEGAAPSAEQTADAVARHLARGRGTQLLLSHDVFLKQMWTRHGGNGFVFVPTVFAELLRTRGADRETVERLMRQNPARMLTGQTPD